MTNADLTLAQYNALRRFWRGRDSYGNHAERPYGVHNKTVQALINAGYLKPTLLFDKVEITEKAAAMAGRLGWKPRS